MSGKRSASGLFITELVIAFLFLSVSCAVCIKFFASASEVSAKSEELNGAVPAAATAAEAFKAYAGDEEKICSFLCARKEDDVIAVYYNDEWEACEREDASYVLTLKAKAGAGGLLNAEICVKKSDGASVYELKVSVCTAEVRQ